MTPFDIRMALRANGYSPIPVRGKKPAPEAWQQLHDTEPGQIEQWDKDFPRARNTGILTRSVATFDGDIRHPEAAEAVSEAVSDWVGDSGILLTRFGNPPKRAHFFRADAPFNKYYRDFRHPNDKPGDKPHRLEFLCDGQQVVAFGIHPETGKEYQWHADRSLLTTRRVDLPGTNQDDARALIDHCADILLEQYSFVEINKETTANLSATDAEREDKIKGDPIQALKDMRPGDVGAIYLQSSVAMSMLRRGYHPDEIQQTIVDMTLEANLTDNPHWTRAKEDHDVYKRLEWVTKKICGEYDRNKDGDVPPWLHADLHADWLRVVEAGLRPVMLRNGHGWYVRRPRSGGAGGVDEDPGVHSAEARSNDPTSHNGSKGSKRAGNKRPHLRDVTLSWWKPLDPATFPAREWLYGRHYQRQSVSLTTAPGGSGKTSLDLLDAIAMATCRSLAGIQPEQRLRVWYHNAEDSLLEIQRRVLAICQHFKINQSELDGWLIVTTCEQFDLKVANGFNELKLDEAVLEAIVTKVHELGIDVAIFDPLINLHTTDEYNNVKMAQVLGAFRSIGQAENCAIEVAQHTRKHPAGTTNDYTGADGRGAGSVRDAARAQRVLNVMSKDEAEKHHIPEHERRLYVRVDIDKANNSPPQAAVWFRIANTTLPNGDEVGVVEPWVYPGTAGPDDPARTAAEAQTDALFMTLLHEFALQGRDVSHAPKSTNYAAKLFADDPAAIEAKVGSVAFKAAMARLFKAGRIAATKSGIGGKARWTLTAK